MVVVAAVLIMAQALPLVGLVVVVAGQELQVVL